MASNFDTTNDFNDKQSLTSVKSLRHPFVVLFHIGFRATAIFFYIFAGWFDSFMIAFIVILLFLSIDFWFVKNITGRLLVGLRWWNFVDLEGKNHWKFESSATPEIYNLIERQIFWGGLVIAPAFWMILVFIAFISFYWQFMIIASIGSALTLTNLYGYMRCKWNSTKDFTNFLTNWAFLSMLVQKNQQKNQSKNTFPSSFLLKEPI